MTSFAFILGCVPLAIATGSGASGREILGTVVVTGMLAATALAISYYSGFVLSCSERPHSKLQHEAAPGEIHTGGLPASHDAAERGD